MRIINNGVSQTPVQPSQQLAGNVPVAPDAGVDGASPDSSVYAPSAELLRLVEIAKQEPAVREDRISEVMQRIQSGDYFTDASAAKTADAMASALD